MPDTTLDPLIQDLRRKKEIRGTWRLENDMPAFYADPAKTETPFQGVDLRSKVVDNVSNPNYNPRLDLNKLSTPSSLNYEPLKPAYPSSSPSLQGTSNVKPYSGPSEAEQQLSMSKNTLIKLLGTAAAAISPHSWGGRLGGAMAATQEEEEARAREDAKPENVMARERLKVLQGMSPEERAVASGAPAWLYPNIAERVAAFERQMKEAATPAWEKGLKESEIELHKSQTEKAKAETKEIPFLREAQIKNYESMEQDRKDRRDLERERNEIERMRVTTGKEDMKAERMQKHDDSVIEKMEGRVDRANVNYRAMSTSNAGLMDKGVAASIQYAEDMSNIIGSSAYKGFGEEPKMASITHGEKGLGVLYLALGKLDSKNPKDQKSAIQLIEKADKLITQMSKIDPQYAKELLPELTTRITPWKPILDVYKKTGKLPEKKSWWQSFFGGRQGQREGQ